MGLLDGGIRGLFGAAFSGFYLDGTLVRVTLVPDGQGGGTTTEATDPIKVQTDACTEAMRKQAGYTSRDVRLLILQSGVPGDRIDTDCRVIDGLGDEYEVAWVTADPANSYWECRGTPA